MKKILSILSLALVCVLAFSQDGLTSLKEQLKSNLVNFNFKYETTGKVPIVSEGNVKAQGNCFLVLTEGMNIYCDGKSKWIVDSNSKEIYIEAAEDLFNLIPQLSDVKSDGKTITAKHTNPQNGTVTKLTVWNVKTSSKLSVQDFVYKIPSGKEWVITDLR